LNLNLNSDAVTNGCSRRDSGSSSSPSLSLSLSLSSGLRARSQASPKSVIIRKLPVLLVFIMLLLHACGKPDEDIRTGVTDSPKQRDYHQEMRRLPEEMKIWAEYTKRTGSTAEGAAAYGYARTMGEIAIKGDADWGKILDDPDIPYKYKTDMIFEILETRLGKGAIYLGDYENLIVPRKAPADLSKERIKLPTKPERNKAVDNTD